MAYALRRIAGKPSAAASPAEVKANAQSDTAACCSSTTWKDRRPRTLAKTSSESAKMRPWSADPSTSRAKPSAYWRAVTPGGRSDPESSPTITTPAVITTTALREDRLSLFLATARPKSAANAGENAATSEAVDVGRSAYAHAYMRLSVEGAEEVVELGVGQCGA